MSWSPTKKKKPDFILDYRDLDGGKFVELKCKLRDVNYGFQAFKRAEMTFHTRILKWEYE